MKNKLILSAVLMNISSFAPALSSDTDEFEDSYSIIHDIGKPVYGPQKDKEELEDCDATLAAPVKNRSCCASLGSYVSFSKQSILASGIIAYAAYHYYYTGPEKGFFEAMASVGSNFYSLLGGAYLASNLFSDSIRKYGYEAWLKLAPKVLLSETTIEIQEIIKRAEAKKLAWSPLTAKAYQQQYSDRDFSQETVKRMDMISRLPTTLKKFNYHEVRARAEVKLATYNQEIRRAIMNFLAEICITSNSDMPIKRKSIFFLGEAGTGKTRMAHLISEILGVYLHPINLSTGDGDNIFDDGGHKPGPLFNAFAPKDQTNNYFNNIILIDEVDKALCPVDDRDAYAAQQKKSNLLKLEDEDTTFLETRYFYPPVQFDFTSAIIIYCGNNIPKDASFLTRLATIRFEAITPELKQIIATDRYKEQLLHLKSPLGFTDKDKLVINEIVEADKKFAGVRALRKVCDSYAFQQVMNATLSNKNEPFDVMRCYKTYLTAEELESKDGENGSASKLQLVSTLDVTSKVMTAGQAQTPSNEKVRNLFTKLKKFSNRKKSASEDHKK
jgi:hypothetical protein